MITTPLRSIELVESSGPVSPRFRWSIHVVLTVDDAGGDLTVEAKGPPHGTVRRRERIEHAAIEALWRTLEAQKVRAQGGDLVGALRSRVGVSFNHLKIALEGDHEVRLDYLLAQLGEQENAARRAIVDAVKTLAGLAHD